MGPKRVERHDSTAGRLQPSALHTWMVRSSTASTTSTRALIIPRSAAHRGAPRRSIFHAVWKVERTTPGSHAGRAPRSPAHCCASSLLQCADGPFAHDVERPCAARASAWRGAFAESCCASRSLRRCSADQVVGRVPATLEHDLGVVAELGRTPGRGGPSSRCRDSVPVSRRPPRSRRRERGSIPRGWSRRRPARCRRWTRCDNHRPSITHSSPSSTACCRSRSARHRRRTARRCESLDLAAQVRP